MATERFRRHCRKRFSPQLSPLFSRRYHVIPSRQNFHCWMSLRRGNRKWCPKVSALAVVDVVGQFFIGKESYALPALRANATYPHLIKAHRVL